MKKQLYFLLGLILLAASARVFAQGAATSSSKTSAPQLIQLIEERIHAVKKQDFTPPILIERLDIKKVDVSSPENLVISWVIAMASLDYEAATKFWDKESVLLMSGLNRAQNKDSTYWIETWKQSFTNRKLVLKNRITYGQYELINYELLSALGVMEFSETVVARNQEGTWYLTLDLADSPVVNGWKKPNERVRKIDDGSLGHRVSRVPKNAAAIAR